MPVNANNPTIPIQPESILVHSPFGVGKTFFAATASEYMPDPAGLASPFKPVRPPIVLEDMIWVYADADALTGFAETGFVVPPENLIDASHIEPFEIIESLNIIVNECKKKVELVRKKTGKDPKIVFDTLSTLDIIIGAYWSTKLEARSDEESAKTRENNNFAYFRAVLNTHVAWLARVKAIQARKIFLCHQATKGEITKSKDTAQNDLQERRRLAQGFTEGAIAAALTGRAWEHYHNQCSLVMSLEKIKKTIMVGGKPTSVYDRLCRPHGKTDIITKTRYNCLAEVEPADMRVIAEKIRKAKE